VSIHFTVRFIGGGNMASALIGGLIRAGHPAERIQVIEPDATARERLTRDFGIEARAEAADLAPCAVAVLAVKPQVLRQVAQAHAATLANALIVSVAAGIRLADLSRWLGGHPRIVRAMPNTPALVGAGVTGLAASPGLSDTDRATAEGLFDAVGSVLWVDGDSGIDLVTAISGVDLVPVLDSLESSLALSLVQLDVAGLFMAIALDTMAGAVALMRASDEAPAVLRARVTSPGGTTERGITALLDGGLGTLFATAIAAARARAAELGDILGKDPS